MLEDSQHCAIGVSTASLDSIPISHGLSCAPTHLMELVEGAICCHRSVGSVDKRIPVLKLNPTSGFSASIGSSVGLHVPHATSPLGQLTQMPVSPIVASHEWHLPRIVRG